MFSMSPRDDLVADREDRRRSPRRPRGEFSGLVATRRGSAAAFARAPPRPGPSPRRASSRSGPSTDSSRRRVASARGSASPPGGPLPCRHEAWSDPGGRLRIEASPSDELEAAVRCSGRHAETRARGDPPATDAGRAERLDGRRRVVRRRCEASAPRPAAVRTLPSEQAALVTAGTAASAARNAMTPQIVEFTVGPMPPSGRHEPSNGRPARRRHGRAREREQTKLEIGRRWIRASVR